MRPVARRLQVLLELPRPLQPGGGASVPGPGVVLSEGPAGPPEERRQPGLTAGLGPLVLLLTGESQVRPPLALVTMVAVSTGTARITGFLFFVLGR